MLPAQVNDDRDTDVINGQRPARPLADLLAGAAAGQPAAWEEIISRYGRLVMHTATCIGLNQSDAADVAQLTWLRLWQHGHQIREPARLPAWLVSTARREAFRLASASSRYFLCADLSAERGSPAMTVVHDVYPAEQEYDWPIARALARLSERYRTLLRLLSSDLQLTYLEVAQLMGLPIGSIGPMRMRAIRMLAQTPEFTSGRFPRPAGRSN